MPHIAVLPGDGIGPEVTAVALRVLRAAGFAGTFSEHAVGWTRWCATGDPLPAETLAACRDADAILFGAITSKPDAEAQAELAPHLRGKASYRSPIVRLRRELDLFANVRPSRTWGRDAPPAVPQVEVPRPAATVADAGAAVPPPGAASRASAAGVDLVIFRENTEDLYAGHEAHPVPEGLQAFFPKLPTGGDAAVTLRVITRGGAQRICDAAFSYAARNGRRKVTLVEKANVLRATGALMREAFAASAAGYPAIATEELHVDAACARLVKDPASFDVVVAANLFGDILSDIAAEVAGGLPLAASANIGSRHALFEPVHGSAPDIAGRGLANPIGAVLSAAMLARHVGQQDVAQRIEAAVGQVVAAGPAVRTVDVEARLLGAVRRPLPYRLSPAVPAIV